MTRVITALTAQKNSPNRINVYLDGVFAFGLARIVAAWLRVGQELSEEKISNLIVDDEIEKAYQASLRYLMTRSRSEKELYQYLAKKTISSDTCTLILERLKSNGLLDDQHFSKTWVENRIEFRPRSKRAVQYELLQKGIPAEQIATATENYPEEILALRAGQKYLAKVRELERNEFSRKLHSYLARKGFSYTTSREVINQLWVEVQQGLISD